MQEVYCSIASFVFQLLGGSLSGRLMVRAKDGLPQRKKKWFLLAAKVVPTESSEFEGKCLGCSY